MRTTINIDDDLLDRARGTAKKLNAPLRSVVNAALRAGLDEVEEPAERRPYRTTPRPMGLRPGCELDDIGALIAQTEGEQAR